jgi:hypothetical protein
MCGHWGFATTVTDCRPGICAALRTMRLSPQPPSYPTHCNAPSTGEAPPPAALTRIQTYRYGPRGSSPPTPPSPLERPDHQLKRRRLAVAVAEQLLAATAAVRHLRHQLAVQPRRAAAIAAAGQRGRGRQVRAGCQTQLVPTAESEQWIEDDVVCKDRVAGGEDAAAPLGALVRV